MINKNESQARQKFVELAEKRVSRALNDMRLIANLSNRSNYSYTHEDAQKIVRALEEQVREVRRSFEAATPKKSVEFRL